MAASDTPSGDRPAREPGSRVAHGLKPTPGSLRRPAPHRPRRATASTAHVMGAPVPELPDVEGLGSDAAFRAYSSVGPLVERDRPHRRAFVPRSVVIGLIVAAVVLVVVGFSAAWVIVSSRVEVPQFVQTDIGVARVNAARADVRIAISEQRYSNQPRGQVLEQQPSAGTRVARGSSVSVVVSAGTEQFVLPDVTGDGIALARGTLESRGLTVVIQQTPSAEPSGTVLLMDPPPETVVNTGDTVKLSVATVAEDGGGGGSLQPYQLQGMVFVLDPVPRAGDTDPPLEVARRLRSLLEASGATVITTRSSVDTITPEPQRIKRAKIAAPQALVSIDVRDSGPGGLVVRRLSRGKPSVVRASAKLQKATASSLASAGKPARTGTLARSPILSATNAPSVAVGLGSASSQRDASNLADPQWIDSVARALYDALGGLYGRQ